MGYGGKINVFSCKRKLTFFNANADTNKLPFICVEIHTPSHQYTEVPPLQCFCNANSINLILKKQ